mgnify:CR=1 FL=1|jgi:hypothetical protein
MIDYIVNELILKPAFKIPQTGLANALNRVLDYQLPSVKLPQSVGEAIAARVYTSKK